MYSPGSQPLTLLVTPAKIGEYFRQPKIAPKKRIWAVSFKKRVRCISSDQTEFITRIYTDRKISGKEMPKEPQPVSDTDSVQSASSKILAYNHRVQEGALEG